MGGGGSRPGGSSGGEGGGGARVRDERRKEAAIKEETHGKKARNDEYDIDQSIDDIDGFTLDSCLPDSEIPAWT